MFEPVPIASIPPDAKLPVAQTGRLTLNLRGEKVSSLRTGDDCITKVTASEGYTCFLRAKFNGLKQ
ncbi:hypothetical protein OOU_Y34scaffold01184g5 [Pyricularia oryzae Y34]|uniref:Uncharacterized protein n=1 Tax=Pyricularia oryzae (strain Y34) TaxID=1143189 RepID=A0AA97NLG5_PYRO3|nr:hypothetical protein OOU_Y34scaffold01184g5 [Pyricularia oryzae Y34]